MPLHSWLPAAMVAPTPVSALLHAVAVVKTGVFATLRVFLFIFGADGHASDRRRHRSRWLCGVVHDSRTPRFIALSQDNLKARLAYSTVSQLSYIVLGGALLSPSGVIGGIVHITNHAVSKITLFFCAGSIYASAHKTEVSEIVGPREADALDHGGVCDRVAEPDRHAAGRPGSSRSGICCSAPSSAAIPWLLFVLLASSLLNAAYLGPIVLQGVLREPSDRVHGETPALAMRTTTGMASGHHGDQAIREVPWMVIPLTITAVVQPVARHLPGLPILKLARMALP